MKKVAAGMRKGMEMGEKIVNAADKASGGMIRQMASTATGGMSEKALTAYNANKRTISSSLKTAERAGKIMDKAGKQGLVGSGAWSMAKDMAGPRAKDYMNQAEGLAKANPKAYAAMQKPAFMKR